MMAMDTLVLFLFITILGSVHQALTQDVEIRAANVGDAQADLDGAASGGGPGGQSRTIYSQRHLSPHRMMHFGKRPITGLPPSIQAWSNYYEPPARLRQPQPLQDSYLASQQLPFAFTLELENGQSIRSVPELEDTIIPQQQHRAAQQFAVSYPLPGANRNNLVSYTVPTSNQLTFGAAATMEEANRRRQQQQQQQQLWQQSAGQRLSKLIENDESSKSSSSDGVNSNSNNNNNVDSSVERAQDSNNLQQQQQQQSNAINLSTRSMHSPGSRGNTISLPPAFVSTLLYNSRQGSSSSSSSSMPSFGASYNKKAEPKDNFFMHFGRK